MTATIITNMGPIDGSIPTAEKVFIIGSTILDVSCMDSPITMASKGRNIMIPTPSDKAANNINEMVMSLGDVLPKGSYKLNTEVVPDKEPRESNLSTPK